MLTRKEIAVMVRSNFKRLAESDIVGRIMLLSGKRLDSAVKGYELLKSEGRFDGFVEPATDGKFLAMLEKHPNLIELIDRLDLVPGKMEVGKGPVKEPGVETIKAENVKSLIDRLNLPDF